MVDEQLANIAANKAEAIARGAAKKTAVKDRLEANRAKAIARKQAKAAVAATGTVEHTSFFSELVGSSAADEADADSVPCLAEAPEWDVQ